MILENNLKSLREAKQLLGVKDDCVEYDHRRREGFFLILRDGEKVYQVGDEVLPA